jgi:putative SOS response-associated peptidase YedK
MAALHNRMPVILGAGEAEAWLKHGGVDRLRPCPEEWLEVMPVSRRVNSPINDDAGLIEPAGATLAPAEGASAAAAPAAQGRLL